MPHLTIQAALVRHAPELQCKSVCDTRHEWMAIHFMLHSVIGPTTWSVSCCRPAVLLLAVILLLYNSITEYISYAAWLRLCIFFTLNRSFYPSTSRTPIVSADFFLLERYKLCGHKTTTEILHRNAVSRIDNAMTRHRTGYDRCDIRMLAIQMRWQREKRKKAPSQIKY